MNSEQEAKWERKRGMGWDGMEKTHELGFELGLRTNALCVKVNWKRGYVCTFQL